MAQNQTAVAGGARLYPVAAAPGDTAWIIGSSTLGERGTLWVGGQATSFLRDPASGWLAFQVPKTAAGGPQFISAQGPGQRSAMVLNVLPAEAAAQDVVAYIAPGTLKTVQQEYAERLRRLSSNCQKTCPQQVRAVIDRLAVLGVPSFAPLASAVTGQRVASGPLTVAPSTAVLTPQVLQNLDLQRLVPSAVPARSASSFCTSLAGIFPTAGLPTGQVLTVLGLLFGPDMQVDPTAYGHPDQSDAPYKNGKPTALLNKFIGLKGGNGKGVTVHILDTATASADDYVFHASGASGPAMYYSTPVEGRPLHGQAVGQIVRAVAPNAALSYKQVCDRDGNCATLKVAQALCAVAAEARRGGRHVVNLSAGGPYPTVGVQLALREVAAAGVPTAAAYGNRDDCMGLSKGDRCWHFPADWTKDFEFGPGIALGHTTLRQTMLFSVAGWDIATGQMATYNRGTGTPGVTALAPSVQAPGEFWLGGWPYFGTSFAAPVVSGVLANWMTCKPGVPLLPLITAPGQAPLLPAAVNPC
ncbi:S8 family serine peptidase [Deinococcus aquaedulcis]|uniref:S8 family serine peptidase n=1 Tax=Deinococcus aquaedulcis TaxID=2840455 RepID=UPI001C82C130|nr:S8 family serine peptidase [Deinococcus aquaedulcis]